MPFLYLPDALSLAMMIVALCLLRRLAVAHFCQEVHRQRLDLLLYWADKGLPAAHPAYAGVLGGMGLASGLAPAISPARLLFVSRYFRKNRRNCLRGLLPAGIDEQGPGLLGLKDGKVRESLRRVQLEFDISLGTYYLLGSISGWFLTVGIAVRLIRRVARRPADRIGWAFDAMEKIFSHLGRRAFRLAHAALA